MKTFEELFNEIIASDELKKEFAAAGKVKEDAEAFLKKYDCSATFEEAVAFLKEQAEKTKELSGEELENVAGGDGAGYTLWGIISVAVLAVCVPFGATVAAASEIVETAGRCIDLVLGDG